MDIIKKLRKIIALYEKRRKLKNLRKIYSATNVSDGLSKTIITEGANVEINSKTTEVVNKVKSEIDIVVNKAQCDPQKLLEYVKAANTKVYFLPKANNFLKNINESEGFIPEKSGFEALFLSVITLSGLKLHTDDMFIFSKANPEKYLVLYNFYKWFSKKSGLSGFSQDSQKLFKRYYKNSSKSNFSALNLEEIVGLQEAISRENEAINYTLNYEKEHEVSKKLSEKISKDSGANI